MPKVRPGGAEKGLGGGGTLGVCLGLDLKLMRGGERRFSSLVAATGEEGEGGPPPTVSTVTIGIVIVVLMSGRGGFDRRLRVKRKPASVVCGR